LALEQPAWLELGSLRPRLAPGVSAASSAFLAPSSEQLVSASFASRFPEIGYGCPLGFEEPQRVNKPRQFHSSDSNGTASRGDLFGRGTGCSLKVADPVDRSVERPQLWR